MVKGLIKKWKMILGHLFFSGGINSTKLKDLYVTAIRTVHESGFHVVFTVLNLPPYILCAMMAFRK